MLELTHVTKKYYDDKNDCITALDDVSLSLPDTGLVIINGTSGCGKTTVLNILGGLDQPTSGEVSLDNVRIDNEDEEWWDSFRGSGIGFIYQDFNLLENMTVRENVQLPLALLQLDEEVRQDRINKIIDELGLKDYLDKKAGKLSGGQKQRVAIARALVTGSKIILADEPTGNLDRQNSENVFRLLKKIARDRLVIVVTHDSLLASTYADRLIQIGYGTIESDKVIEDNIDMNKDDATEEEVSFFNETSTSEVRRRKLSLKECLQFAREAMRQRRTRCCISVMIFTITMLFTLVLCEAVFRNDSAPITEYINDKNQKILPLFMEVQDEYGSFAENGEISSGRKVYDLICQNTDKSRIIRHGGSISIEFETGRIEYCPNVFVSIENEKYFTFEGEFPEKENELAISKDFADKLENSNNILGSSVFIQEKEYTITAIVTQVCGRDIKDIYVDEGYDNNWFEDVIFLSTKALADRDRTSSIYMSGFGVTSYSNLFYQTTVYNNVCSVDSEMELLSGRMPNADNEILISRYLYELMNQLDKDTVGNVYRLDNLYEDKYGCSFWNLLNLYDYISESFTIVGVAEGSGDYYVTESLYDKMFNEYMIYYEAPYYLLADESTLEADIYKLLKNDVKIKDVDLQRVYDLMKEVDALKIFMIIVVAVIALLSVLQMISLYSYSINDNKKTIGILRTLGVNKSDTKKIFTVECMVISVLSFVIAIIISIFITSGINNFISQNIFEFDGFSFLHMRLIIVIITGIVNCALSALSVLIPIRKFSKMKIIELIK